MQSQDTDPEWPVEWWPVDPVSGLRLEADPADAAGPASYLGDCPLDAVAQIATAIDAAFNPRRHFSDDEVRSLLLDRVVPASVRPYDDAAAELLDFVDALWDDVHRCYQETWGRPPNPVLADAGRHV